mgnify:CR=1 FL=1
MDKETLFTTDLCMDGHLDPRNSWCIDHCLWLQIARPDSAQKHFAVKFLSFLLELRKILRSKNISFAVFYGALRSRLIIMSSVMFLIIVLQSSVIFWVSLRFENVDRTSVVLTPVSCNHSFLLQSMHAAIWEQLRTQINPQRWKVLY